MFAKVTLRLIFAVAGLALACPSVAASPQRCSDEIITAMLEHFAVGQGGEIRAASCKPIRGESGLMIAVVAHAPLGYSFAMSESPLPYYAAIIELNSQRVIASYKGGITEDGAVQVFHGDVSFDETTYSLARGVVGFGLLVGGFRQGGAMDGGQGPQLTLLAFDGKKLRPVVEELSLLEWRCSPGACKSEGAVKEEIKVDLSIGDQKSNGFRDLVLVATRSHDATLIRYRAKYNGVRYVLDGWSATWHK